MGNINIDEAKSLIEQKLLQLRNDFKLTDSKIAEEQKKINRRAELDKLLPQKSEKLENIKTEVVSIREKAAAKSAENTSFR